MLLVPSSLVSWLKRYMLASVLTAMLSVAVAVAIARLCTPCLSGTGISSMTVKPTAQIPRPQRTITHPRQTPEPRLQHKLRPPPSLFCNPGKTVRRSGTGKSIWTASFRRITQHS